MKSPEHGSGGERARIDPQSGEGTAGGPDMGKPGD